MRCIALAQMWQQRGGHVVFLSRCESQAIRNRIKAEGFDLVAIKMPHPHPSDLEQTLNILQRYSPCALGSALPSTPLAPCSMPSAPTWLALDGYHFTPEYQKAIRDAAIPLLVIDDMNHLPRYHADVLLNQSIHAPNLRYHCNKDTTLLLGTRYILLRREFLKYRKFARQIPEKAKNILVTMGGSDPDNVTLKVIDAIKLLNDPDLQVKIIIGPSNPYTKELKNAMLNAPCSMLCFENVSDMPELMAWADMAVSAGGVTCWELAFMCLPACVLVIADNHASVVEHLHSKGIVFKVRSCPFKTQKLGEMIGEILMDRHFRRHLAEKGRVLVDGAGAYRVVHVFFRKGETLYDHR